MNENETTALVRAFDRAYINGKFVTPHGTQVVDLVNPTNNTVIGKVTMADEIDKLLLEARQELAREYLNRPDIDVAEVAYLLGYEDSNSFYRAFRTWEGTTPSQLRAELKRPVT